MSIKKSQSHQTFSLCELGIVIVTSEKKKLFESV